MISSSARRATATSVIVLALASAACTRTKTADAPVGVSSTPPFQTEAPVFAFDSLDARPVSTDAMRGKPTVLLFILIDNLGCQAEVNYLTAMAKNDEDKVNYVLVAIEPRDRRELVEMYRRSLGVTFPVALADEATRRGGGPFPLEATPTIVVLDRDGRVVWRTTGLARPAEIRAHLNAR